MDFDKEMQKAKLRKKFEEIEEDFKTLQAELAAELPRLSLINLLGPADKEDMNLVIKATMFATLVLFRADIEPDQNAENN